MNLSAIRTAQTEAQHLFAVSLRLVCEIAEKHDPNAATRVAEMRGYQRELEALSKLELEIITHGKTAESPTA